MLCIRILRRPLFNAATLNSDIRIPLGIADAKKPRNDVQVVVIGAGLAGLSATAHLIKHGFHKTLVVEATERFGGRVNSKHFGDAFCELGAKWIAMDASKNSIYELLKAEPGLQKSIRQNKDIFYVNTKGQKVNPRLPEMVDNLFKQICSNIEFQERYLTGDLNDLNSVYTYLMAETAKASNAYFEGAERQVARDIFTLLSNEFGSVLGCCLEYVNIEHITKLPKVNTWSLYIPTGLDNLLNPIAQNLREENLCMGKPVGEIVWTTTNRHDHKTIGCLDGSAFTADHIICTLPLGVLKTFSNHMFKPPLPASKLQAIKNIGFGSPVKIYFEYNKNVKPWFRANIRPLWSNEERRKDLKWIKQVVEISKLPTSNRVLEILVGGQFYADIEKLPDVEVLEEVTKILRTCFKNQRIPYPTSMLRSAWSTSACYLGGRPYFSTQSSVGDVMTLAAPLGGAPNLLFAGDATILNGFGTIDGARMSGIREAERIIQFYEKSSDSTFSC